MPHHPPLITTLVVGIVLAFALGMAAHRLRASPLVGYLLAGVLVGPFTPGFVADQSIASELADIGEPVGEVLVGDEAGRERPDRDACQQVADQRRGAQAVGCHPEGEGQHDADHEGGDERRVVLHLSGSGSGVGRRA